MRREIVAQLEEEKRNRVHAILANGSYLQTDEGVKARGEEIRQLEEDFTEMINDILDPQPEVDLSENPFFDAGRRAVEKLRWDTGIGVPIEQVSL